MKKGLLVALLLVALVAVGAVGCSSIMGSEESTMNQEISSQQDIGIWVTGVGKVAVTPDIAVLVLGVEVQKDTVAEAQQQAATAMDAVMNVLDGYSIEARDIQTQQFSIQPVYSYDNGQQILLGYRVTNIVTVKIRNMNNAGGIIDAAVAAGGDYARVNSISFTVDEPEAYYDDARQAAMADAKAKAEDLAHLGGVGLGKPTYINEYSSVSSPVVYRDEGAAGVPETAISPGETEIQLTIQVVYSIK
jgi:uncharacterized protein YggE